MIEQHVHDFAAATWPFKEPEFSDALTTVPVLEGEAPILLVSHDADDGMWQVLCGTTNEPEDGRLTCLGCLLELDPTLAEIADLPRGWEAYREAVGAPWAREPSPADDASDEDDG
ncbi:MAG: hypothetical protein WCH32_11370 [Pseudomonadota bacterium]|nr:hypothetical protein [Pseudomonadota bacterium]